MISSASASMSSALSFVKGLGMSSSSRKVFEPRTTNAPLRGLSGLMLTLKPAALRRPSSLVARVLNAPQDLHASIKIDLLPAPAGAAEGTAEASALGAALAFFAAPPSEALSAAALRLGAMTP